MPIFLVAFSAKSQTQNYTIKGNIGDLNVPVAKAYVIYDLAEQKGIRDSAVIVDGKFEIKGKVPYPLKAILYISPNGGVQKIPAQLDQREVYLVSGTSTIKSNTTAKEGTLGGTSLNSILQEIDDVRFPFERERYRLHRVDVEYEGQPEKLAENKIEKKQMEERRANLLKDIIKKHLNSLASVDFVAEAIDPVYHLDEAKKIYSSFPKHLQESNSGRLYKKSFSLALGLKAPDFTVKDTTGSDISLSSFRGSYVLLDFWASWCIPCRYQNPKLIKVYNKFKEQNFKIFGVSLDRGDRGKEMWVKAILSDSLPWNQGSDLQGFESEISKNYMITYVPTNYLIDPDGKIIAKNIHGEELEKKLNEIYGK